MSDLLERAFEMTGEILAAHERGERVALRIIERDKLLRQLSPEEHRLFYAWADQEQPS